MLRPFALVGFSYLLALTAAVYFGAQISMFLACMFLFAMLLSFFVPQFHKTGIFPVVFCTVALAFGAFSVQEQAASVPAMRLQGKEAIADFTVAELPSNAYNRTYYVANLNAVDGQAVSPPMQVRITSRVDLGVEPYERLQAKVRFSLPQGEDGFSSRSYYASRGIRCFGYLYDNERVETLQPNGVSPYYYALLARKATMKTMRKFLPRAEAGFLSSVLIGDKSGLSEDAQEWFRTIGLSHLLAVSGMHMSTIAALFLYFLKKLRLPQRLSVFLAAFGILAFMAVTGFVPSASRSGIMYLLFLLSGLFGRRSDALNALGFSVLILCLINPLAAADMGLLLSFAATLGLLVLSEPICTFLDTHVPMPSVLKKPIHGVHTVLATSIAASIFTLPILLLSFRSFSPLCLLANILQVWPSTVMVQFGAIAAVLYLAFPWVPLYFPFAAVAGGLARYMLWSAEKLASIPYANLSAAYGFITLWLMCVFILVGIAVWMRTGKHGYQAVAALSVALLFFGTLTYQVSMRGVTRVAVLNTLQGGTCVIVTRDSKAAVIGTGGNARSAAETYLNNQNIKELAYIQPLSVTGTEGKIAAYLLQGYPAEQVVLPKSTRKMNESLQGIIPELQQVDWYRSQAQADVWQGFTVRSGENAVQLEIQGVKILLCGKTKDLKTLPADWLASDFAVVQNAPEHLQALHTYYTVLSMPEEDTAKVAGLPYTVSAEDTPVFIQIAPDGTLKFGREG